MFRASVFLLLATLVSPALADDLAEAKKQFDLGAKSFALGDYPKSIEAYKRSYELSRKPLLLYDLGQAYRKLGDARQALHFYKQYLAAEPAGKYAGEAKQQVSTLTDLVAKMEVARVAPPDGVSSDADPKAPRKLDEANREAAKALYDSASWHYGLTEYQQALSQFEEAYRLYAEPSFLFNVAQCQRQLGKKREALESYRAFVRDAPNSTKRADAMALIDVLRTELSRVEPEKTPEPTTAPQPNQLTSPTVVVSKKKTAKWVWGVVGASAVVVVGLAVGLGVGLSSRPHYPHFEAGVDGN